MLVYHESSTWICFAKTAPPLRRSIEKDDHGEVTHEPMETQYYYIRYVNGNTTKFDHQLEDIYHSVTQPQTLYIKKIHDILMKYIYSITLLQLILCPTTFCFKYSLNTPRHRLNKGIYQSLTLAIPYLL